MTRKGEGSGDRTVLATARRLARFGRQRSDP